MLNISKTRKGQLPKEDHLYALDTLNTPRIGRTVARVLVAFVVLSVIIMFLPWQQNIRGLGQLTALEPQHRPQKIETAISGRISEWRVMEGDFVHQGDTIVVLSEIKDKYFDPELLKRLEEQMSAKRSSLSFKKEKREALVKQVNALKRSMALKLEQAENKLIQSRLKVNTDSLKLLAEELSNTNAQSMLERNELRYNAGNINLTKYQEVQSKGLSALAKLNDSKNKLLQSKAALINAEVNIASTEAEYLDKISKAESSLSSAISEIYETEGALAKLENQQANMVIRNQQYQILAPQSGLMVKALKVGVGETVKEGEGIAMIMPSSADMAVEMYVKAVDIPFVSENRKVRVQFDGWPTLQFSGWEHVSVGTFGGIVKVIDAVSSKPGAFRILVAPDPDDDPWPIHLRYGSGVKGWVMLNDVPIWFEIWRNMNGFPPEVYEEILLSGSKTEKVKK